jgi:glucose-1-phosphate adenylyltransferase
VLILSGDHIYTMDYEPMISFHLDHQADVTVGTIRVPIEEASRFGMLNTVNNKYRVTSFVEKPPEPPSNLVNMGVYLFNRELLDKVLWEDRRIQSPRTISARILFRVDQGEGPRICLSLHRLLDGCGHDRILLAGAHGHAFPTPALKLYDRSWIIHTRTEERPPARLPASAHVYASMICDGCYIGADARVESSVLSPGVVVRPGAVVRESIILTDCVVESGAVIERAILDKRVTCRGQLPHRRRRGRHQNINLRWSAKTARSRRMRRRAQRRRSARMSPGSIIDEKRPSRPIHSNTETGQ